MSTRAKLVLTWVLGAVVLTAIEVWAYYPDWYQPRVGIFVVFIWVVAVILIVGQFRKS